MIAGVGFYARDAVVAVLLKDVSEKSSDVVLPLILC